MEVTNSTIDFKFMKRKYLGQASMFQPAYRLMVRVYVPISEKKEEVFVFYKLKPGELFWYDLQDDYKQSMAKAITSKLLN